MGKTFVTSRVGNVVTANYDNTRTYVLSFEDETEAKFFVAELAATQKDFWDNGRDNAIRKKSTFANPQDCTISMNFNTAESAEKWAMKAKLSSVEEMKNFYEDLRFAIWGPMPG